MSSTEPTSVVQDTSFSAARIVSGSSEPTRVANYGSTPAPAVEAVAATKPTTASSRAIAPDLLRGLILPLMSLDHAALFMGAWLHGTPKQTESAATPLMQWNFTSAYVSRTITHLCAPGFFFLMGMGCVYFHRSRARIGWERSRMVKHFVVRALALIMVSEVMGQSLMFQKHILIINIVMIGLGVDYLLTGLLCLLVEDTEKVVARAIDRMGVGKDETRAPLLADGGVGGADNAAYGSASDRSQALSFWLHNIVLASLTYITIFWNVWLSPTHGQCASTSLQPSSASRLGAWFDFWFFPMQNKWVMSGFPPLAWVSFCIFGMLYARIMLHRRWTPKAVVAGNVGVAVFLAAVFVATRLLHFGNLSEACLHMPEHLAHPRRNQYLASIKSFFYITKYPPSPSFFALTMAVNFGLLALFSAIPPSVATAIPGLMNYGGSALFFYVAHMYLYSVLAIPARYFFEHDLPDQPPNEWERTRGVGATAPFWITWVLGLVMLNPMCKAYGRFKAAQSTDSLWRFF